MEKRNFAYSISDFIKYIYKMPGVEWKDWTVQRSVKYGYKASGWVYRAISIIARNAAQAPIVVYNPDDEIEWEHPLTLLLQNPNPKLSYNAFIQLLISWLNLTGESYIYQNNPDGQQVLELWPFSPDRLKPVLVTPDGMQIKYDEIIPAGAKPSGLILDDTTIIPCMFPNPADPLRGIGPLQVAARAVDTDSEQTDWNKAAMQNRGVMDGFFSFDREIPDEATFKLYLQKVKDRFSGTARAREPGVIGSGAKYQQLSLTPVEMDFLNSRKFNREEIFIIFGVPPQLAGVSDTMTYNNFAESLKILWESTVIPQLELIKDSFSHAWQEQLGDYYLGFDYSNVKALKKGEKDKAETAKIYFDMGIPVSILNEKFELGIEEYEGWDISGAQSQPAQAPQDQQQSRAEELRAIADVIRERDNYAENQLKTAIAELLDEQRRVVFSALDSGSSVVEAIKGTRPQWLEELLKQFKKIEEQGKGAIDA